MKKIILIAPLLLVLTTAFSAWTDEAHHQGTNETAAAALTQTGNMPGMKHMEGMGGKGMMGMMRMMAGMDMEKMPAECRTIMGEKMAMM